jgi:L,D-transpeptidase YcbB
VKSVRFEHLLASSAFGLILALSSHAGMAQQSEQQVEVTIPVPNTAQLPPSAAKDVTATADPAKPDNAADDATKPAPKQNAAAPSDKSMAPATDTATGNSPTAPKTEPKQEAAAPSDKTTAPATDTATGNSPTGPKTEPKQEAVKVVTPPGVKAAPEQNATAPAAAPAKAVTAPQATLSMDGQVADALRDLITGKRLDRFVDRKEDRDGVERFYKEHDYKPLWTRDGKPSPRAKAAIAFLSQVQTDGMIPDDYPTPDLASAMMPDDLAQAELRMTDSVLKYARQAQVGRINFTRVGADISFKLDPPDPAEVLAKVAATEDMAKTLDGYNPPQQGFKQLKAKLAELRANGGATAKPEEKAEIARIPQGKILRPGMKDSRVVLLRKRLDIAGDKSSTLYDNDVVDSVKAFQTKADIGVDGMLGPDTVRALNGERDAHKAPLNPIDTVIVNMERWRWLPRKLGNEDGDYVMVNVPDYSLTLYHQGKPDWHTIIVAGKPSKATPMTSAEMKYITVNPTWNVPPSIVENEYLPALQEDPTVLDRYGLKIYQNSDGTVHIYQPPGAGNALGRIRFNFPNKFLVYQHDTPDKYLFKRAKRAYSHGCMRVQDPAEYATKLLALELPQDNYTPAKLQSMYGSNEININFPHPIPVHLTYQTAFVDPNGKLQFRDDVYGRDAKMIAILKNSAERKVADIPIERAPNSSDRPVKMPVGTYADYNGDNNYGGGATFFDFLFGGGPRYRAPPRYFIGPRAGSSGHYTYRYR